VRDRRRCRAGRAQRLDAFVSILRQYLGGITPSGNNEPHVSIVIDQETFLGRNTPGRPGSLPDRRRRPCLTAGRAARRVCRCRATHHVIHWAPPHNGPTNVTNGILACWIHHRHVHELRWTVELQRHGECLWRPPNAHHPYTTHPHFWHTGNHTIETAFDAA